MKLTKELEQQLKILFTQRLLVLLLGSAFGEEWVGQTMDLLLPKQIERLASLGVEVRVIQAAFEVLETWLDRGYGLNFIDPTPNDEAGPTCHLTFIDEMDSNLDVIHMRAALDKLHAAQ